MIRPVADACFMTDEELARERGASKAQPNGKFSQIGSAGTTSLIQVFCFWAIVAIPAIWGAWMTIVHAVAMVSQSLAT
jgi:hypothetical protein